MVRLSVVVCSVLIAFTAATEVQQCPGKSIQGLTEDVTLTPCKKIPCKLKKGTRQHVSIAFTPETDIKELKNHVTADVLTVPVPFIGVDGNSVCDDIEDESGAKVSCPLKAGTKYVYKGSFPVLEVYPTISTKVHWALQSREQDVICFERWRSRLLLYKFSDHRAHKVKKL